MANSGINRNIDTVISTLNDKADRELENSNRANNIERLADSSYELAAATSTLVEFTVNNVNSQLETKVSNTGDTINGNVVINGTLDVTGGISATIQGTTANATKATQDSNGNVIVSTYATKAELANISGNPVGTIIAFASNTVPNGYLLCSGATVSRTTYSKLFEVIGTLYGEGDGSTTFTIPNLADNRFLEGATTAGSYKAAGLPDATGLIGNGGGDPYGIFYKSSITGVFTPGSTSDRMMAYSESTYTGRYKGARFALSSSNSIYSKSTTVQPLSITVRFFIKY